METKGAAVATIPLFVKEQHGGRAYQNWLDALPPKTRDIMSGSILPSMWYPMQEAVVEPTRVLCDLIYRGEPTGALDLGRFSAKHGLRGVYRLFIRVASPEFIVAKASQILPTYYRPSRMAVAERGKNSAVVQITEFPEPNTLVEYRIMGWMKQALQMCGVKSEQTRIKASMTQGSPFTEFHIAWT